MHKIIRSRLARLSIALAATGLGFAGLSVATAAPSSAEPVCGYASVTVLATTVRAPIPGCSAICVIGQGPNEINPLNLNLIDVKTFECVQNA